MGLHLKFKPIMVLNRTDNFWLKNIRKSALFSDFRPQWSNKLSYVKESFPVRQMQSHQGPWTTINFPREEFSCKNLSWVKTRWSEAALEFVARFLILIFCTYSNNNDDLSLLESYFSFWIKYYSTNGDVRLLFWSHVMWWDDTVLQGAHDIFHAKIVSSVQNHDRFKL